MYYNPYFLDPQKGTPNFGKSPYSPNPHVWLIRRRSSHEHDPWLHSGSVRTLYLFSKLQGLSSLPEPFWGLLAASFGGEVPQSWNPFFAHFSVFLCENGSSGVQHVETDLERVLQD